MELICKNCKRTLRTQNDEPPQKCPFCDADPTVDPKPETQTMSSESSASTHGAKAESVGIDKVIEGFKRYDGMEKDFFNFKLFITHRLVSWLWSLIVGLSVLWMFTADEPSFLWRVVIILLIAVISRVFFEFVVVLFSIADLLREVRDALLNKKVSAE